jgi:hypothetical protein
MACVNVTRSGQRRRLLWRQIDGYTDNSVSPYSSVDIGVQHRGRSEFRRRPNELGADRQSILGGAGRRAQHELDTAVGELEEPGQDIAAAAGDAVGSACAGIALMSDATMKNVSNAAIALKWHERIGAAD